MQLFTVKQVSKIIHKSAGTIYNDITRRPDSLPPVHRLPNCQRVFFKDVEEWMRGELTVTRPKPTEKKRGRPSHASKLINK